MKPIEFKEGDNVLCTVEKIVGTTVFVRVEGNMPGSIVVSEIAPGRIRNLRDYVVPNKKIVCKVLRAEKDHLILSLRRVTQGERKEVLDRHDKEKNALSILKSVLSSKALEVAEKIRQETSLAEFFQNCRASPEKLKAFMTGEEAEKICKILSEKKEKKVEAKKEFALKSMHPDGIKRIKRILNLDITDGSGSINIKYLAASRFVLSTTARDFKEANAKINKAISEMEKRAKQEQCDFSVREK